MSPLFYALLIEGLILALAVVGYVWLLDRPAVKRAEPVRMVTLPTAFAQQPRPIARREWDGVAAKRRSRRSTARSNS